VNRYAKYRALVALADARNFSRAAEQMGLSQPALTRSIQALESAVGGRLVERSARQIELTPLGQQVVDRARLILDQVSELDQQVASLAALNTGNLKFGAGPYPTLVLVPDVLVAMAKRYPGLEMAYEMEGWQLVTQRVKERELDLVVTDSVDAERDQELQVSRLKPRAMRLVARAGHPLADAGELTVSDLLAFPFATTSLPPRVVAGLRKMLGKQWRPNLSCDDVQMLMDYVQLTDALTFMPEAIIDKHPDLSRLSFTETIPGNRWGIIRLANRTLAPAAQVLMGTIKSIDRALA
jgi:DNA-binding transcriptional LysR family regulator